VATAPSSRDNFNPEIQGLINKHPGGKAGILTQYRVPLTDLIRELTSSYEGVLTLYAERFLAAQRLSICALVCLFAKEHSYCYHTYP
jgi:aromatic ring hydroxylase